MKPIKLVAIFALAVAIAVGGFSMAVAAATGPVDLPDLPITLSIDSENVEVSHDNGASWIDVADGETLNEGDMVKTDATGSASINYYDQGVTRLDANTTITIQSASWDPDDPDTFEGNILLQTGRLWARLFDFLSPDSSFNVETDATVASVRGTVFSVWTRDGMDGVYVDDHRVHVSAAHDQEMVSEGWMMKIDPKAEPGHVMNTTQDIDADWTNWISKNRDRDEAYDAEVLARWKPHLKSNSWIETARRIRMSLTSEGSNRQELRKRFTLPHKMLERLEAVPTHADVPAQSQPAAQPEVNVDTTTSLQIFIDGQPVDTQTLEPTAQPVTEPTVEPTPEPVVEPTTEPAPEPVVDTTPAPYPVSLTIFADDYTLATGAQTKLHANLLYSDDTWVDVAEDVNWDVFADPQTGQVAGDTVGATFYAGDTGGTAPITGTYYAGETRFQDDIEIIVTYPADKLY